MSEVTPVSGAGSPAPVAVPVAVPAPAAPAVAAAPAPKLTAIQLIEQDLLQFFKQREQAIANVHAIDGAIQAAQGFAAKLRAEAAKAETAVVDAVHDIEHKL